MSLNLGLESLGIVSDSDVTYESVLEAEAAFSDAQIAFERACFKVATEARNISNFNEIIDSLQRHSSQECVAFAQDLLGTTSLEKIDPVPGTPEKPGFKEVTKNAWESFKNFVKTCYEFIKKWSAKLLYKLHILSQKGFTGEMKMHYTLAQLKEFNEKAPSTTVVMSKEGTLDALLNLSWLAKKAAGYTLKLEDEADKYCEALRDAQGKLWTLFRSAPGSAQARGTVAKTNKKGEVTGIKASQPFAAWFIALIKRLRPFQKNVMADFNALMKRAAVTASATASDLGNIAKKTEGKNTLDPKKVAPELGGKKA